MSVFSSLIDQAEVVKALKDAVLASRNDADKTQGMTHAWLFTGPPVVDCTGNHHVCFQLDCFTEWRGLKHLPVVGIRVVTQRIRKLVYIIKQHI